MNLILISKKLIIFYILFFMSLNLFGTNFEDKFLKCSLIEMNKEEISERRALAMDEDNLNAIITEVKFYFKNTSADFKYTTENNKDIYTNRLYGITRYMDNNNILIDKKYINTPSKSIYQCKKASFLEKIKMKAFLLSQ